MLTNTACCKAERYENDWGPRIIGGHDTSIINAPFIASLQRRRGRLAMHICGAVIITKTYLLTAAHCITNRDENKGNKSYAIASPKKHLVSTGSTYAGQGNITWVKKFFVHPDFNARKLFNDIGTIAVARDLVFNMKTQPGKLPEGNLTETSVILDNYIEARTECKAYGWGLSTARSFSGLKVVGLHLIKTDTCQRILARKHCKIYKCIYIKCID
ncbi:unnamed protein product [Nezara viridula]|uniref:Peptidase S1 domain-containing protein n=1 Tax=Nezara viridula TaxID=85310 RepID=A0A9P0E9K0_NEZVI|nr:unnamed protein product [Nezara viridula]